MKVSNKILIVDDDLFMRTTYCSYLEIFFPDAIILAEEGHQALRLIEEHGTDISVIITDINMPNGMGGIQLLENLNSMGNKAHKIVISGYPKNFENESLPDLCDVYYEKPADLKVLIELICIWHSQSTNGKGSSKIL